MNNTSLNGSGSHDYVHEETASFVSLKTDVAQLKDDVAELKTQQVQQLAILTRIDKLTTNPVVRTIMTALGAGLVSWLASKGWVK
jgi:hypothetical protein